MSLVLYKEPSYTTLQGSDVSRVAEEAADIVVRDESLKSVLDLLACGRYQCTSINQYIILQVITNTTILFSCVISCLLDQVSHHYILPLSGESSL